MGLMNDQEVTGWQGKLGCVDEQAGGQAGWCEEVDETPKTKRTRLYAQNIKHQKVSKTRISAK